MTKRISELFGMDIYSEGGKYKGKVHDIILDLQQGRITTITTDPLPKRLTPSTMKDAEKIVKSKSVAYDTVRNVSDVVIVSDGSFSRAEAQEEQAPSRSLRGRSSSKRFSLQR